MHIKYGFIMFSNCGHSRYSNIEVDIKFSILNRRRHHLKLYTEKDLRPRFITVLQLLIPTGNYGKETACSSEYGL